MSSGSPSPPDREQPLFSVRELTKTFTIEKGLRKERLRALHDVSFDLFSGECLAVVGESGSGKSTLLRQLCGLDTPSSGTIHFLGEELDGRSDSPSLEFRSRVQLIFQDPFASLNPAHSVFHHIKRPLLRHGRVASKSELLDKVKALLCRVGLNPPERFIDKRPHQMSGGQRQRVAIARALSVDPLVFLADEPTSMLDVSIRMGILNLMKELKGETGAGLIYVTHDITSASYIADRVLVMYAGQVVEEGPTRAVLGSPAHPYTRLLLEAVPRPGGNILRRLSARSGSPQLINPLPGCAFQERCPETHDRCRAVRPGLIRRNAKGADAHLVKCHLYDQSP